MTNQVFNAFSEEQQAEYQKYAEEHWDSTLVQQSVTRWNALDAEGKKALLADGERITLELARSIQLREDSPVVQGLIAEWYAYINRFYDCSPEIFLALGEMYMNHPDFQRSTRRSTLPCRSSCAKPSGFTVVRIRKPENLNYSTNE